MTPNEVTAARERAEKATEGPWRTYYEVFRPQFSNRRVIEVQCNEKCPIVPWVGFDDSFRTKKQHLANARFIAHARTDVPALCDALDEARAEVEVREINAMARGKLASSERADKAEAMLREMATALETALRQWRMYAENEEDRCLKSEPSAEGDIYTQADAILTRYRAAYPEGTTDE